VATTNVPALAFVGAGKVGTTLARLWYSQGYTVETVYSRSFVHAEALAKAVDARAVVLLEQVRGDLLFITVPDDAIRATAEALAGSNGKVLSGGAAVHTSGARDASELRALAACGIQVGSLHPAYPFADVEGSIAGLPGATFALEAQNELLLGWLRELVGRLNGQVLLIPPKGKATYHAALVLLSNYTVTLYALAETLLKGLGAEQTAADQALNGLLAGTVDNLRLQGLPDALTGPLTRADTGTVAAHLKALGAVDPRIADLYVQLARLTYPLLAARGMDANKIGQIERLFERDSTET
jgi:predicted short-subunit dehydrogenase-like oxidoreductase (DUF2520 family)